MNATDSTELMTECPSCSGTGEAFTARGLHVCALCNGECEVTDTIASDYVTEVEDYRAYLQRKSFV